MYGNHDTIAAISTAVSESGIGIIRISGQNAFSIADEIFTPKKGKALPSSFPSHTIHYGHIHDQQEIIDEVLLSVFRAPSSYTAEDTVEINCHGGVYVLKKVLETVFKYGARPAEPGEFTKRAFLHGRIDLSQAEAVMDVINAKNEYALHSSLHQLSGAVAKSISALRREIVHELAVIESALDDPEHYELTGYDQVLDDKISGWTESLEKMIRSFNQGRLVREGIRTVILGKPNVGKSSLLNLLSGSESAIVTEIEGTTRDVITETIQIGKMTLLLHDTAGIHAAKDKIEQIGVEKAVSLSQQADLLLCVLDGSGVMDENDLRILDMAREKNAVIILNKEDLPSVLRREDIEKSYHLPTVSISARTGAGKEKLEEMLEKMFFSGILQYNDEVMITNERHQHLLKMALESLKLVRNSIRQQLPEDFYSIDLQEAGSCLGQITGEATSEDVIKEIFESFCMGK